MKTKEKKARKLKSLGVKTILYDKNKIFGLDGFVRHPQVLFDAKFADIDKLNKLEQQPRVSPRLNFKLGKPKGFVISSHKQDKNQIEVKIKKLKKTSFSQKVFGLSTENNLESQIFSNFYDLKIQIIAHLTNVLFAINSRLRDKHTNLFDVIGDLPVNVPYSRFDYVRKNYSNKEFDDILDATQKVLKERAIYVDKKNSSKELAYDFLRLLGLLRQFCAHGYTYNFSEPRLNNIINIANKDLANFTNSFVKTNRKYFDILNHVFKNSETFASYFSPIKKDDVFQQFFDFCVFDESKNFGFSFDTIRKNLFESKNFENNYLNDIPGAKRSEFLNKLKTITNFYIWKVFTSSESALEQKIMLLHQTENLKAKENLYTNWVKEVPLQPFKAICSKLKDICGTKTEKTPFPFRVNFQPPCQNNMLNVLYVFSKFLTDAEANQFYSSLINKFENVRDILFVATKENIKISDSLKQTVNALFRFENLAEDIKTLKVYQNLRKRKKATSDNNFNTDWGSVYEAFNAKMTMEEFEKYALKKEDAKKAPPLKKYLINDVFKSKEYQYIYHYASPQICKAIFRQPKLVEFALYEMLGSKPNEKFNDDKQFLGNHKYLLRIYYAFNNLNYDEQEEKIDKQKLQTLYNALQELTLDKINDCIFHPEQNKNYKALTKLYFKICYLITRILNQVNASYVIAFMDYEAHYRQIFTERSVKYNFALVEKYLQEAENKNSRSYKQVKALLQKDYAQKFYQDGRLSQSYEKLISKYRNVVCHGDLLSNENVFKNISLENISSYFALYQILMQKLLQNYNWLMENKNFFELKPNKQFSTKLCIALNFLFAYSPSRFNNLTIEKYSMFGLTKSKSSDNIKTSPSA